MAWMVKTANKGNCNMEKIFRNKIWAPDEVPNRENSLRNVIKTLGLCTSEFPLLKLKQPERNLMTTKHNALL